jgi:hypothetical protein
MQMPRFLIPTFSFIWIGTGGFFYLFSLRRHTFKELDSILSNNQQCREVAKDCSRTRTIIQQPDK